MVATGMVTGPLLADRFRPPSGASALRADRRPPCRRGPARRDRPGSRLPGERDLAAAARRRPRDRARGARRAPAARGWSRRVPARGRSSPRTPSSSPGARGPARTRAARRRQPDRRARGAPRSSSRRSRALAAERGDGPRSGDRGAARGDGRVADPTDAGQRRALERRRPRLPPPDRPGHRQPGAARRSPTTSPPSWTSRCGCGCATTRSPSRAAPTLQLAEHRLIAAAVAEGDPDLARRQAAQHIDRARRYMALTET